LAEAKQRLSERITRDVPEYDEDELRAFYVAVVQSGAEGGAVEGRERETKRRGIGEGRVTRRIGGRAAEMVWGGLGEMEEKRRGVVLEGALKRLRGADRAEEQRAGAGEMMSDPGSGSSRNAVAGPSENASSIGQGILSVLGQALPASPASPVGTASAVHVGLGLLSRQEWKALLADCVRSSPPYPFICIVVAGRTVWADHLPCRAPRSSTTLTSSCLALLCEKDKS
jgi:hypothetical protein